VRIDGRDHFINRLGRWDDPVAVAKAQALSAKIWRDYQSGSFDRSLRIYKPLINGHDLALLERLRINVETRRQKRAIHAHRVIKRYGKTLKSLSDSQEFLRWAQDDQGLSNRTIVSNLCKCKRSCPESKNLFQHYLHYKKTIAHSDVLSTEEIKTILADLKGNHEWFYPSFSVWLSTGLRNGEICGLTWDRVRWDEGELLISKSHRNDVLNAMNVIWASTKTGQERIVPMSPLVNEVLQQHKAAMERLGIYQSQGLVFVTPRNHRSIYDDLIGRRWKQSLQRCGIKHRRFYTQRHSFLSHALAMGNATADLAQIAGHSTQMLLKTYAKPTGRVQIPNWIAA